MHHSFHLTTSDGLQLVANEWRPDGTPLTSLMLIHGQGEHLGRYHAVGEMLAENGIRVMGVDLRGHGLSDGKRGHVTRWNDYFRDLDAMAELLPAKFAILGHSMGGLLALGYGLRHPQRLSSITVSGPLLGVSIHPAAWKEAISGVLSVFTPSLRLDSGIPMNELSSDPQAVQRFADDALRVGTVTPRWYIEMKKEIAKVFSMAADASVPLYTHMGAEEKIVAPDMVHKMHESWGHSDKTITLWPDCCHELFQEYALEQIIMQVFNELEKSSKK
ncbi:MAG: acylglycerol lipase [Myxococcota bacterium]|jgi:acylglycerol lipase